MGARADRLNRVLLTLLALLLLAAGVAGLLLGTGVLDERYQRNRVLPDETGPFVTDNAGWLWPVVTLLAVVLSLLALRWLLLQLGTDRRGTLDLTTTRTDGETRVEAGAVTDALVDALERLPGVDAASARFITVKGREQLLLHVRLADRADVAQARQALADGPLTELRQVLGEACPPVVVELEPSTRGSSRELV